MQNYDLNSLDSCLAAAMVETFSPDETQATTYTANEAWDTFKKEEPKPSVLAHLAHPDNDTTVRLNEGAKFIEHDPSTEDGKAFLLSLLEGTEEWNSFLQTLNLGSVVCMVKNQVYTELLKQFPEAEFEDSYFKLFKEQHNG